MSPACVPLPQHLVGQRGKLGVLGVAFSLAEQAREAVMGSRSPQGPEDPWREASLG